LKEQRKICPPISIPKGKGNDTIMHQKDVSEWHRTLGCRKTIDGSGHATLIQERCNEYGYAVKNSRLNRAEEKLAYNQMFILSILHALPATSLLERSITNIQRYVVSKYLSVMG
jgi:hypothetical protein